MIKVIIIITKHCLSNQTINASIITLFYLQKNKIEIQFWILFEFGIDILGLNS